MANILPLADYFNPGALADRTTVENVPLPGPPPRYPQWPSPFFIGGFKEPRPPGSPSKPGYPGGTMPVPLAVYPPIGPQPSDVRPPQLTNQAPPLFAPKDFPMQDGGTLPEPQKFPAVMPDQQMPPVSVEAPPIQGGAVGSDSRYRIQPRNDFEPQGSPQQQQSGMKSDAGMWGLLAAGLGILANNYGNYGQAGPAIGKGGLMGLETFLGQRQIEERQRMAQQELDQRNQQIGINRRMMDGQISAQERAAALQAQKDDLIAKFRTTKNPDEKMAIMEELALLSDSDSAYSAYMRAKNGSKKYIKGKSGIPGQPDMEREVLIDPETLRPVWEGEPVKRGSLVNNVVNSGEIETAGRKEMAKIDAKRVGDWGGQSDAAGNALVPIARMERAVENAKTYDGIAADYQKSLANILNTVGIPVDKEKLAESEVYESQMAQWVRNNIKALGSGTAISNVDLAFTVSSGPTMKNSPQGKKLMLKAMRADLEWIQDESKRIRDYYESHNGSLAGFQTTPPNILKELQQGQTPSGAGGKPSIRDIMRNR